MLKKYLLAPGPTMVPEKVLLEMAMPMIHHRTSEFSAIFADAREGLKKVFGTQQDVLILAGTGTAGMEAAIVNTLSPGDKVLVVNGGKFGQRWGDISKTYGLDVDTIDLTWGESVDPVKVERYLIAHPETRAVMVQASETSTTAYHPIKELAAITALRQDTILIVDGITSVGVHESNMDEWGVDVYVSGSQKAFMLPPGLAFIALSEKAWKFAESSKLPKFYFDLKRERKNQAKNTTAYTPGVSLIIGLKKVMEMYEEEGLANVYRRHAVCAEATRAACVALGLPLLVTGQFSGAATGCCLPEGFDGGAFVKYMREKVGVTLAGGQDHLKGKILRISHLGYHDMFDTLTAIGAIEMGLKKFGLPIELGKGTAAAQAVFEKYMDAV